MAKPVILITNDDGIDAPGIAALEHAFRSVPDWDIIVVAPDGQRSASGHAMNMFNPLRLTRSEENRHAIDGTPADCVKVGYHHFCPEVALVVSGINSGPNMAVDTFYSGTVAAAREAAINGIPGIAVSMNNWMGGGDYTAAARIALLYGQWVLKNGLKEGVYLNINVPDCPVREMKGVRVTGLGKRVYNETMEARQNPYGQTYFWLGCGDLGYEPVPGSDLDAVAEGYISVTPMGLDCAVSGCCERYASEWEKLGLQSLPDSVL